MPRPTIHTADGIRLAGRRWLVDDRPIGTVVLVHGFTASADCENLGRVAEALHGEGYDIVTYDARGHGSSEGLSTLGDHEEHDVAAAVALGRERGGDVIVVGASMGAIAALRYAATDPALSGVVAVSCPARWRVPRNPRAALAAVMTQTPPGRWLVSRATGVRLAGRWTSPTPPDQLVAGIDVPVAFVHGSGDKFIPPGDAHELHERANEPRSLSIVPEMGHAFDAVSVAAIVDAVAWCRANASARA